MTADLNRELITPLQEFDSVAGLVSKDMVNELTPSIQTWARETTQSISAVQSAMQTFQVVAVDAFMETGDATVKAGIAAAIYGENTGKAMEQAAKAALASIAEQAGVSALNALAQGLWFLAQAIFFGDPDAAAAAATDFEAAAEWGAIAGVAGAAAAAMPSGGGGGRGAAASRYGGSEGGYGGGRSTNGRVRPCTWRSQRAESTRRAAHRDGGGRGAGGAVACDHAQHCRAAGRAAECHNRAEVAVRGGVNYEW